MTETNSQQNLDLYIASVPDNGLSPKRLFMAKSEEAGAVSIWLSKQFSEAREADKRLTLVGTKDALLSSTAEDSNINCQIFDFAVNEFIKNTKQSLDLSDKQSIIDSCFEMLSRYGIDVILSCRQSVIEYVINRDLSPLDAKAILSM